MKLLLLLVLSLSIMACDGDSESDVSGSDVSVSDDESSSISLDTDETCDDECSLINAITGSWTENPNSTYTINSSTITNVGSVTYIYEIVAVGSDYIIALNDLSNPFFGGSYSKFLFTNISSNELYYCQSFFDEVSQISIEQSIDPSDFNDLVSGCGGFAWGVITKD